MPADNDNPAADLHYWYGPDVEQHIADAQHTATRSPYRNLIALNEYDPGQITLLALNLLTADLHLANHNNRAAHDRIEQAGVALMGNDYHHNH